MSSYIQNEAPRHVCDVCKRPYVEPRILSCLHSFCTNCIYNIGISRSILRSFNSGESRKFRRYSNGYSCSASGYESDKSNSTITTNNYEDIETLKTKLYKKENGIVIICPICFHETQLPKNGCISMLPINHFLKRRSLSPQQRFSETMNPIPDKTNLNSVINDSGHCDLCTAGLHSVAYCRECTNFLCAFCSEAHKRQRKTMEHNVLTLQEAKRLGIIKINSDKVRSLTNEFQNTGRTGCHRHRGEEVHAFCETCLLSVCHECSVSFHRSHLCVSPDIAMEKQISSLKQLITGVKPRMTHLKTSLEDIKNVSTKLNANVSNTATEINKHIDNQIAALESHRRSLHQQLKQVQDDRQRVLKLQKVQLEQLIEDFKQCDNFVENLFGEAAGLRVENLDLVGAAHQRLQELFSIDYADFMQTSVDTMVRFNASQNAGIINGYPMQGVIVSQVACPSRCFVKGNGLQGARVGQKSEVVLVTRDMDDQPVIRGQEKIQANLIKKGDNLTQIHVNTEDRGDGSYMLTFTPDKTGTFHLHVAVNNKPIKGSPFYVYVQQQQRRKHSGIYHCCSFCSSNGKKDAICACNGVMPGGYKGCGHGHKGHPGKWHWNCCGRTSKEEECTKAPQKKRYEFTL